MAIQNDLNPFNGMSTQTDAESSHLDLYGIDNQPFGPRDLLKIVFRRIWILVGITVAVLLIGIIYTKSQPRIYQSTTKIMVASSQSYHDENQIQIISELQALTQNRSIETQVEIVSSPDLLEAAYKELPQIDKDKGFGGSTSAPDGNVLVAHKRDTDIIEISVQSTNPAAAANYANLIAQKYFEKDLDYGNQATHKARVYVEAELKKIDKELNTANSNLSKFKMQTGLFSSDAQLQELAKQLSSLQADLDKVHADIASESKSLEGAEQMMAGQKEYVLSQTTIAENPRIHDSLSNIDSLMRERANLVQEYTETSPEVTAIDARIASEKKRLQSFTANVVASEVKARNSVYDGLYQRYAELLATKLGDQQRAVAIEASLRKLSTQVRALPYQEQHLTVLMQRAQFLQSTFTMLTDKLYTLRLSEHGGLQNGRIVSEAKPSPAPIKPRMITNASIALLLGLVCALLCVILVERIDDRIHDLQSAAPFSDTVLAELPRVPDGTSFIINRDDKRSGLLESFRMLRNNIAFLSIDKPIKTLAITSAGVSEGKSSICTNLAYVMALEGKRVVVVECDLRRPSQHTIGGFQRDTGLTNILTGTQSIEAVIRRSPQGNFDIILAGPLPPNPPEVLNSQQFRRTIQALTEKYDIVILDCPPTAGLSDVPIVSTFVDALLFVVRMDATSQRLFSKSMRELAMAKAPFLGLIVNSLDFRHHGYGYGYYYQYYYHEDEDGRTKKKSRKKSEQ